ncbi:DNA translocase FtsK [Virgibacillus sp. NKC19-16]|uniref:DNA translocase FtsK n=1 Tax=Virgibacillus salidurans TaxID=2831673 RepID=UPI001F2F390F|nr:DNA translocase FtsK [Virgibacillus sp. NKC19-16]UJL45100.1 DNA translocase FtsK [Virgibacillus sp. NKC19-16]
MWEKIKNFFTREVEYEQQEENPRPRPKQQDLQAKMMYQYPDRKAFKFPVIPDREDKAEKTYETPAFQRKKNTDREREKEQNQQPKNKQENKVYKKDEDVPFQPTEVPSPVYGYQKKNNAKNIENIPAFKRKEQKTDEQMAPQVIETQDQDQPSEVDKGWEQAAATSEIVHSDVDSTRSEVAGTKEEVEIPHNELVSTKEEVEIQQQNQEVLEPDPDLSEREEPKKTEPFEQRKSTSTSFRRKQSKKPQQNKGNAGKTPFNVIMTPRDKKNRLEKEKAANTPILQQEKRQKRIPYYLLDDPQQKSNEDHKWVQNQQQLLEQTLKHFNVRASVVKATQGPSVTRFEVQPELGVKVSKVKNLSDDLKLNMAAKDIRIEAPIPGKNTIGIEVPNPKAQMVGLQGIFEAEQFKESKSPLSIALGLSIEGSPLITDIQKMPHGLIAGATGSGKSVCINTILISLLYKANYEDVKFLLIDPKMVELAPYNGIPHLVSPVITDVKAATAALKWAVKEMEDRYEKFVQEGVRDIERYNQQVTSQRRTDEKMPFIVIVIDELADLMMVAPQDVEDAISRIAQKARACGIHLLVATQRPSVDVITGLIKANIPTRIAFSVSSQVDSRTIIDTSGAEKLLGKGDMLFVENGAGKSVRLQGPFVSDDEIERVTNHARTIAEPQYLFEQEQLLEQVTMDKEEDSLLQEAIAFVLEQNNASTSLLQRHFKIGYNRAARLIDSLEDKGIISGQNGSKPREVLVTKTQIEEM